MFPDSSLPNLPTMIQKKKIESLSSFILNHFISDLHKW
ncbi:hypothetical protein ERO13_D03G133450v2 [Gossypium hirsutum]|uniref:Uncharacterized protein n=2 Tax=Gossypium TaxID=3633 RepID=A0A5J5S4Q7_GOSBA|nr:hypothetical protein ES319_D03G156400v1 [Gossypium barbadense]KAG4155793.1 hypothetical protein ERO13_D03G133450v2 [Gossypium hirsutum]TYI90838.1 hypothetical protein E1A91_D03G150600v1 [Gossypium mustelinum]